MPTSARSGGNHDSKNWRIARGCGTSLARRAAAGARSAVGDEDDVVTDKLPKSVYLREQLNLTSDPATAILRLSKVDGWWWYPGAAMRAVLCAPLPRMPDPIQSDRGFDGKLLHEVAAMSALPRGGGLGATFAH